MQFKNIIFRETRKFFFQKFLLIINPFLAESKQFLSRHSKLMEYVLPKAKILQNEKICSTYWHYHKRKIINGHYNVQDGQYAEVIQGGSSKCRIEQEDESKEWVKKYWYYRNYGGKNTDEVDFDVKVVGTLKANKQTTRDTYDVIASFVRRTEQAFSMSHMTDKLTIHVIL